MTHILLAVIYLAFISLGLPDSLLGAAWPSMYGELGVPVSRAGMVSMIICFGTIVSWAFPQAVPSGSSASGPFLTGWEQEAWTQPSTIMWPFTSKAAI